MKAYWIKSVGAGTQLEAREMPMPQAAPAQVLIRTRAVSLNRGDMLATIGRHRADTARPAGVDGAGEVIALGDGVTRFACGDRVMFRAKGAYAECVVAEAGLVSPIPPALSWEQAAAVPVAFITAWEATLQFGGLQKGAWLLIAGASSGVGVAALQIARMIGARTVGISGSADKLARLRDMGLDAGIQARGEDFAARVLEATQGKRIALAINLVGGSAFAPCLATLADHGRLAVVGYVDGVMNGEIDLEAVHGRRLQIFGLSNAALMVAQRAIAQRGFEQAVLPALADGRIVPVVDRIFDFDDLPAAKAYVETDALLGKVVARLR